MAIFDQISKSVLGYKGQQPAFDKEDLNSTLHDTSDTLGTPKYKVPPSQLSEDKTTDFYRVGNTYLQNLPN